MTSQTKCWCGHHERYHGGDTCTFCDKGQLNEPHPFGLRKPMEKNPLTLRENMAPATPTEQPASVADGSGSSSLESNFLNREYSRPTGLIKTIGGPLAGVILGIWVFVWIWISLGNW